MVADGGIGAGVVAAALDPVTAGGVVSLGIYGIPWIPFLAWVMIVGGIATVHHLRGGGTIGGPSTWARWLRPQFSLRYRSSAKARIVWLLVLSVPILSVTLARDWDPLSSSEPFGPGPSVAEVRNDGVWQEDWIEQASSFQVYPGPCVIDCPGPRYVYRVHPGDSYASTVTIRNDGPVPITLLGRAGSGGRVTYGLALLRDPSNLSADAGNLRPFEPVSLGPGGTITVATVHQAPPCANPAADVSTGGRHAIAYPFVYELLGWRRSRQRLPTLLRVRGRLRLGCGVRGRC